MIEVVCMICGRSGFLRGPLERVQFLLQTLTACPLGSVHESLPVAAATSRIVSKGDTL